MTSFDQSSIDIRNLNDNIRIRHYRGVQICIENNIIKPYIGDNISMNIRIHQHLSTYIEPIIIAEIGLVSIGTSLP